jgi:hypothetical protein
MTLETVKVIKRQFAEEYLGKGNINGVGIGWDKNKNYCIKVYLERKNPSISIPTSYQGVKVIVEFVGKITAS